MAKTRGELYLAFKKEKDPRIRNRMLAVRTARIRGLGIEETAENLMQCLNWVRMSVIPDVPDLTPNANRSMGVRPDDPHA